MTRSRRLLIAALTACLAVGAVTPTSLAQDAPPPAGAPIQPPVEEAGGRIDSWALAPAGSLDPEAAGNRPDLSYEVDPGATIEDAITVFNYGNVQMTFDVYATDARNTPTGEFDSLPGNEDPVDVGSWITVEQDSVTVLPGQQVTMPITIEVPADATPGDHVGAVLASNAAEGVGPDGKTIILDRRTGTRVYLRVAGPIQPELAIENVKASYRPSLNPLKGTATVEYRIRNRGNVRLSAVHAASVSGPFGLAEEQGPDEELPELLPGEDAVFTREFKDVPATVLAVANVRLEPSQGSVAGEEVAVDTQRSITLALPISVVLLLLALWLGLRARKAYRRHRSGPTPNSLASDPRTKEPQLT